MDSRRREPADDIVMPAEHLRAGDVFSLPGVVVRGPFRVLRAREREATVRLAVCDPNEDTAYPLTPGALRTARSVHLWHGMPVIVHARNQF